MNRKFDISSTVGRQKWYEEYEKTEKVSKHSLSEMDVLNLKSEGKKYLDAETTTFQMKQSKLRDSDTRWLHMALQRGTTSDKIAANVVLIQENPKYNLGRLVSLVSQVRGSKHNQYGLIIMSLKELFLSDLLHPKFRLLKLEEQDLHKLNIHASDSIVKTDAARNKLLAHWYFEDQLREQYEHFILNLSTAGCDTVDTNRDKVISIMTDLLINNSEQEHKLLQLIVNKIGDPNSKIGSKTVFCINKLLYEHPNMKLVVLREIEKLLFRNNVGHRTQYYAICLLTQYILNKNDNEIANTLMEVYFAFFKACLKRGEPDSKMMAAILMGVNRAYPYIVENSKLLDEHIDSIYKVVHLGSLNVSLNALCLLHQVTNKDQSRANRFYSAFYRKLLDHQIEITNKRGIFLNLVYRVLRTDHCILRSYACVKRILQISLYFPANMTCALLYIISKILQERKDLRHILLKPRTVIKVEQEEIHEVDNSLLDTEDIHVIEKVKDKIEEENTIVLSNVVIGADSTSEITSNTKQKKINIKTEMENIKPYDPFCRNPLYAGASKEINIELETLAKHYHPSVALFANQIIQGKPIIYTGDPLEDLALIRFLDRYVFKNPKKLDAKKVQRKNDPLAQHAGYAPKGVRSLPVNSEAYINEREDRIPVDELFLHQYMKRRNEMNKRIKKEDDDDNEDLESVNSEEFNDMLDRMGTDKEVADLDIAANIVSTKKKGTKAKHDEDDEDDDEDDQSEDDSIYDDDDDDDDDGDISEDFNEDIEDFDEDDLDDDELQDLNDDLADVDDNLSDMEFNGSEDENLDELIKDLKVEKLKMKNQKGRKEKRKGKGKEIDNNIFVSAEKFAEMLEEQGKTKKKHGSSNTFSLKDGASDKQLDWELKRHQRLRRESFDKKRKRFGQSSFNNKQNKRFKR